MQNKSSILLSSLLLLSVMEAPAMENINRIIDNKDLNGSKTFTNSQEHNDSTNINNQKINENDTKKISNPYKNKTNDKSYDSDSDYEDSAEDSSSTSDYDYSGSSSVGGAVSGDYLMDIDNPDPNYVGYAVELTDYDRDMAIANTEE